MKLQRQNIATIAELEARGLTNAQAKEALLRDTQVYVTAGDIDKTLNDAIQDGDIGAGGAGGGVSINWERYDLAAVETQVNFIPVFRFGSLDEQQIFTTLTVPESYLAGNQISLKGLKFIAVAGDIKIECETTLLKVDDDPSSVGSFTSSVGEDDYTPDTVQAISEIPLTDSSGEIDSRAVAAGDILLIRLFRDVTNESSSADSVDIFKHSIFPDFGD